MKVDNRIVFGVIGGALVGIFLWGRSCGVKSVITKAGRIDTTYLKPDTIRTVVTHEVLKPYAVLVKGKDGKIIHDTVIVEKPLPEDTIGVYNDYFRTYAYSYQERLRYGVLTINDTLSQNMFVGRSVTFVSDSIPVVTRSILIQQPKKLVLYLGASAFGNRNDLLYGAGVDLSLQGLNGKQYGVGITYTKGNNLYYGINYRIPIRLKKK